MAVYTYVPGPDDGEPAPDLDPLTLLLRRLKIAHLEAGRPTYLSIGRDAGLSASTICRIFKATKPPAWDNLTRVLNALGADPDQDGTWRELWRGAMNRSRPVAVELSDGVLAPGHTNCPDCGVWISDPDTHQQQHQNLDTMTKHLDELRAQLAELHSKIIGQ